MPRTFPNLLSLGREPGGELFDNDCRDNCWSSVKSRCGVDNETAFVGRYGQELQAFLSWCEFHLFDVTTNSVPAVDAWHFRDCLFQLLVALLRAEAYISSYTRGVDFGRFSRGAVVSAHVRWQD
jgi:hypothetical protein